MNKVRFAKVCFDRFFVCTVRNQRDGDFACGFRYLNIKYDHKNKQINQVEL